MYAVVTTGGKQYRVEAGSELIVERLTGDPGTSVTFDRVLLVGDGDDVTVGTPTIAGATVSGTVIGEQLGPKLIVFKFKQKVKYRRLNGHRQHLTRVRIDEISAGGRRRTSSDDAAASRAETPATEQVPEKPARTRRASKKAAADTTEAAPEAKAAPKAEPQKADASDAADVAPTKPATRRRQAKRTEAEE